MSSTAGEQSEQRPDRLNEKVDPFVALIVVAPKFFGNGCDRAGLIAGRLLELAAEAGRGNPQSLCSVELSGVHTVDDELGREALLQVAQSARTLAGSIAWWARCTVDQSESASDEDVDDVPAMTMANHVATVLAETLAELMHKLLMPAAPENATSGPT